jgi:hypothetical protein
MSCIGDIFSVYIGDLTYALWSLQPRQGLHKPWDWFGLTMRQENYDVYTYYV